jgi:hypothetical protein
MSDGLILAFIARPVYLSIDKRRHWDPHLFLFGQRLFVSGLAEELLAPVHQEGENSDTPGFGERRSVFNAGEAKHVAQSVRPETIGRGHRIQRQCGRRDSGILPHSPSNQEKRGQTAGRESGARPTQPSAVRATMRYRAPKQNPELKEVDDAFWDKFQTVSFGRELEV